MGKGKAVMLLRIPYKKIEEDIEAPLFITANDFLIGLNQAYDLKMNTDDMRNCYLKSENPISLLKGNRTLEEFGLHDGTIILIDEENRK